MGGEIWTSTVINNSNCSWRHCAIRSKYFAMLPCFRRTGPCVERSIPRVNAANAQRNVHVEIKRHHPQHVGSFILVLRVRRRQELRSGKRSWRSQACSILLGPPRRPSGSKLRAISKWSNTARIARFRFYKPVWQTVAAFEAALWLKKGFSFSESRPSLARSSPLTR